MFTILITGIHGFLGSNLAINLSAKYNTIIGLGNKIENEDRLSGYKFQIYSSKDGNLEKIFTEHKIDIVIHAATVYKADNAMASMLKTNIELPVVLYELSNKHNVGMFINTDSFFNDPKTEYTYLASYTLSKKHVLEWLKAIKRDTTIVNMKIFHMYGPFDSSEKFVSQIVKGIVSNNSEIKLTLGEQTRDFIYINDVVKAYDVVIDNFHTLSDNFYEFEVGTGSSVAVRTFVELLRELAKSSSNLLFGSLPYRQNEIMYSIANNSALKALGWQFEYDVRMGINNMLLLECNIK